MLNIQNGIFTKDVVNVDLKKEWVILLIKIKKQITYEQRRYFIHIQL